MIQPETVKGRKEYFRKRREEFVKTWVTDAKGIVHIPLRNGLEALIDARDKDLAANFYWRAHKDGPRNKFYVEAKVVEELRDHFGKTISLHRLIVRPPSGYTVDHVNGNPLDCRRANMRVATPSQNATNRRYRLGKSPYRGVVRSGKKWGAQIEVNQHNQRLGTFNTAEEAARAYNEFAGHLFGEFAILNKL